MVPIDLTGRVALVTGGTRGIGRAIAQQLHAAGAKVAITGRDAERAKAAAAELSGGTAGFGCEMTDAAQVEAAVAGTEAALGPVDILVNNAGLTRDQIVLRMSEADWDTVLGVNLKGAFVATRSVLKGMMKR